MTYVPELKDINTALFQEEANRFRKYGYYCNAPKGTKDYINYWDEQKRRRIEGYTVGGVWIPGEFYGYLNFARILKTSEYAGRKRKFLDFPDFYDMDYIYFKGLHEAKQEGLGMIVAKSRRKGFSYKNAWLVANEFNLVRESISVIGAYLDNFADNTVGMAVEMLDFMNKHTAWGRQRNPDRRDFMKAQFRESVNGTDVWSGYKSEIHKITFKDDAFKSIGKSCSLFMWEEAGKFPNLIKAYRFSEPTWRDGDVAIGTPIIFGTGGDMEGGTQDFAAMFYSPETYGLKAFDNIWDEGKMGTKCGIFIPDYLAKPPYIDEYGNSDVASAIQAEEDNRERVRKGSKRRTDYDAYVSQQPFTPAEAFIITKGAKFPASLLARQLADIETKKDLKFLGDKVILDLKSDGTIEPILKQDLKALDWPFKKDEDKSDREGCIIIYEHPKEAMNSPYGTFFATCDPYDQDEAENSNSVGSCIIWKTITNADEVYDFPVATYHGRPEKAKDFYENVRRLCLYYNAVCLYENEKRGLEWHFDEKGTSYLLKDQPDILDKIIKNSSVKRPKGTHMVPALKSQLELWGYDWLVENTSETTLNLNKIYDPFLIKQLITYNDEGNFDSVIAFLLAMLYRKELKLEQEEELNKKNLILEDTFFTKKLFTKSENLKTPEINITRWGTF